MEINGYRLILSSEKKEVAYVKTHERLTWKKLIKINDYRLQRMRKNCHPWELASKRVENYHFMLNLQLLCVSLLMGCDCHR
jgi:hypothetical protein